MNAINMEHHFLASFRGDSSAQEKTEREKHDCRLDGEFSPMRFLISPAHQGSAIMVPKSRIHIYFHALPDRRLRQRAPDADCREADVLIWPNGSSSNFAMLLRAALLSPEESSASGGRSGQRDA